MEYPILILDEPHLTRLIDKVIERTRKDTPRPLMTKQECYDVVGRTLVDRALSQGDLKAIMISGSERIRRIDFEKWINDASPVRKNSETKIRRKKF